MSEISKSLHKDTRICSDGKEVRITSEFGQGVLMCFWSHPLLTVCDTVIKEFEMDLYEQKLI